MEQGVAHMMFSLSPVSVQDQVNKLECLCVFPSVCLFPAPFICPIPQTPKPFDMECYSLYIELNFK